MYTHLHLLGWGTVQYIYSLQCLDYTLLTAGIALLSGKAWMDSMLGGKSPHRCTEHSSLQYHHLSPWLSWSIPAQTRYDPLKTGTEIHKKAFNLLTEKYQFDHREFQLIIWLVNSQTKTIGEYNGMVIR